VLSKTDRFNIAMNMYNGAANKVLFILEQNDAFKANILPLLGFRVLDENIDVYNKDDYADEVYFIVVGAVNFLYGNDFCFRNMLAGSHFGEYEVIKRKPREFSVMSQKKCEFLIMKRNVIDLISRDYHEVYHNLKKLAEERKARNEDTIKQIINAAHSIDTPQSIIDNKTRFRNIMEKYTGKGTAKQANDRSKSSGMTVLPYTTMYSNNEILEVLSRLKEESLSIREQNTQIMKRLNIT
jgi:CRP-like cAMP-binding protein